MLNDLQILVAESLSSLVHPNRAPSFVEKDPLLKKSFEKYGFPFAGLHWIPHLSIASLKTARNHPLISEFQSWEPEFEIKVDEMSCWRVGNDEHILIGKLKL